MIIDIIVNILKAMIKGSKINHESNIFLSRVYLSEDNIKDIKLQIKDLKKSKTNKKFGFSNKDQLKIVDDFCEVCQGRCKKNTLHKNSEISIFGVYDDNIKNVTLYEIDPTNISERLDKKIIKEFGNLNKNDVLQFNIYYTDGIPNYKLEWESENYTKGELYFQEDGETGNVDFFNYEYQKNIKNMITNIVEEFLENI